MPFKKGVATISSSLQTLSKVGAHQVILCASMPIMGGYRAVHNEILRILAFVGLLAEREKIAKEQPQAKQKRIAISRASAPNPTLAKDETVGYLDSVLRAVVPQMDNP